MTESSPNLSTQEKLLLAQAVYKYGATAWSKISQLLVSHPCCRGREEDLSESALENAYIAMMTGIEINVPAPDATKPQAKIHLRLAQTYYLARMEELKTLIADCENRFTTLMNEIKSLKSGADDAAIQAEIRAVLVRKYGKKLVDTWVPPADDVKAIMEGKDEPVDGEVQIETDVVVSETVNPRTTNSPASKSDLSTPPEPSSPTTVSAPVTETLPVSSVPIVPEIPESVTAAMMPSGNQESSETRGQKRKSIAKSVLVKRGSRRILDTPEPTVEEDHDAQEASQPADSQLAISNEEVDPSKGSKLVSGRADSPQTSTPAATVALESGLEVPEIMSTSEPDVLDHSMEIEDGAVDAQRQSPIEEGPPSTRGRIQRAASNRATSVVSTSSAPTTERPKRGKRLRESTIPGDLDESSLGQEGMEAQTRKRKASVVQEKPVVQAVVPEKRSRSSRRTDVEIEGQDFADTEPAHSPEEAPSGKSKRTRSTPSSRQVDKETDLALADAQAKAEAEAEAQLRVTQTDGPPIDSSKGPNSPAPSVAAEKEKARGVDKATQKMISALLDSISSHRNGNLFAQPIKASNAKGYYEIIKQPMDLKKMRARIRDGSITSIEEFQRDLRLMFSNAMAFNQRETEFWSMAEEMSNQSEETIMNFKTMQLQLKR